MNILMAPKYPWQQGSHLTAFHSKKKYFFLCLILYCQYAMWAPSTTRLFYFTYNHLVHRRHRQLSWTQIETAFTLLTKIYDWLVESLSLWPYIWRLSSFTFLHEKQHRKEDPVYWKLPTFCCGAKLSSESPDYCYCAGDSSESSWIVKFPGKPQQVSWLSRYFDLIII